MHHNRDVKGRFYILQGSTSLRSHLTISDNAAEDTENDSRR